MQGRDSLGRFVPGGSMSEEIRRKISETQVKRREEAREFGTPPDMKKCNGPCGRWLPREENFLKRKIKLKSGKIAHSHEYLCHECRKKHYSEYRKNNREKLQKSERARYQKNQEKICKDARERHRMTQALAGHSVVPLKKYAHEIEDPGRLKMVPVGPFVEWYESLNGTRPTQEQLGEKLAKAVRRATSGQVERMHLDLVDEVGVLVGMPHIIHTLYTHE